MCRIIRLLSNEELEQIKSIIEINYKNMYFIKGIIHWLKKDNNTFEQNYNEKLYNGLEKSYQKLILNVSTNNINIYSKSNYSRFNIYCLMDSEESINQMKYINEKNIFGFLADMITNSVGTGGYGYLINSEIFNKLSSYETVDAILSKINDEDLNDTEKFIKRIYEKSKEKETKSSLHEKAVYVDKFIDLREINIK